MSRILKAVAKRDCTITVYMDLNYPSFNHKLVKKGEVLEYEVHSDQTIENDKIAEIIGRRNVTFKSKLEMPEEKGFTRILQTTYFIPTYDKDFEYID